MGSAQINCNINVKLNYKFLVIFYNLKKYETHVIMQVLGKLNLKINVILNGLKNI